MPTPIALPPLKVKIEYVQNISMNYADSPRKKGLKILKKSSLLWGIFDIYIATSFILPKHIE